MASAPTEKLLPRRAAGVCIGGYSGTPRVGASLLVIVEREDWAETST